MDNRIFYKINKQKDVILTLVAVAPLYLQYGYWQMVK